MANPFENFSDINQTVCGDKQFFQLKKAPYLEGAFILNFQPRKSLRSIFSGLPSFYCAL